MENPITALSLAAFVIGLTHTIIGPDHYLPFIVLSTSLKWSLKKTLLWAFLCGLGHVASSVVLGTIGIVLGWNVPNMEYFEESRGSLAAWALIAFGGIYMLWGIFKKNKNHCHQFHHGSKENCETNIHKTKSFWTIFIIFVLGPCEPLIPLLMVPAASHSITGIIVVTAIFSFTTIGTMLAAVTLGYYGFKILRFQFLEKYMHVISGGIILLSGLAIKVLGL